MLVDFALLPFHSIARPSLGVSILQAIIALNGHQSHIHYLNLSFAKWIGPQLSEWIALGADSRWLIGEWIFAPALFPTLRAAENEAAYLRHVLPNLPTALMDALYRARQRAPDFINEMADEVAARHPDVLGMSTSFQQNCASLALAEAVKRRNKNIIICFGGANCEDEMAHALAAAFPQIDCVFTGEADRTFPDCLEQWSKNGNRAEGQDKVVSDAHPPTTLDHLPLPKFDDYFTALQKSPFAGRVTPGLVFETSRGCYKGAEHQCGFCGLNGARMAYRTKSAHRVIEELCRQSRKWHLSDFEATDNIVQFPRAHELLLCLTQAGESYHLFFEVRQNLKREDLQALARAGVTWIQPGIESLDDNLLQLMRQGGTALQGICLLRNCMEIGLRPVWNLLMGIPGETPSSYEKMMTLIPLIEHLPPPEHCNGMRLDRFSPFYRQAASSPDGAPRPVDAYRYVYDLSQEEISKIAYFFEMRGLGVKKEPYHLALQDEVRLWQQRFFNSKAAPVCTMMPLGDRCLIKDTRKIATLPIRTLDPCQTALLLSFDRPRPTTKTILRFKREHPAWHGIDDHFSDLVTWGHLLVVGDRALALPVSPLYRVHSWNDPALRHFPGGHYTPDEHESALFRLDMRDRPLE